MSAPSVTHPVLSVKGLYEAQKERLQLKWLAGTRGEDKELEPTTAQYPGLALVGHLNFIHPNRVQVIGDKEFAYLDNLQGEHRDQALQELCRCQTTSVIIVAANPCPGGLAEAADAHHMPLIRSTRPSPVVIEHLQYYLTRALAPLLTCHGVYMEVMGMGVFIIGESGIGKSELALELLSRNHRLIADDVVEFVRVGPDVLVGQCPEALTDYLEVRGLGILNIRAMFGETAVRHKKKLHFIVNLERLKASEMDKIDRLQAELMTRKILDVEIPEVKLFVAPGRNLAVLVEAATRTYILRMWGINPLDEFSRRQQDLINKSGK